MVTNKLYIPGAPIAARASTTPIGYRRNGSPVWPIAGGGPENDTLEDDAASVVDEETINRIVAAAVKELAPLTKPDAGKIATVAFTGEPAGSATFGDELSKALDIERVYGRELHTCQDQFCGNRDHGLRFARLVRQSRALEKAGMLEGAGSTGGFLVPEEFRQDLIPLLRARAVVRAIGTPVYPMSELIANVPRQSAAGTGFWEAEAGSTDSSNQTLERLILTAKRATAMTYFSNELLADSTPQADAMIRDDLIRVLALLEDKAFLIGGAAVTGSPTGIYRNTTGTTFAVQSGVGEVDAAVAAVSYDNLVSAYGTLLQANVPFVNVAWVMHGRDFQVILGIKDAEGRPMFVPDPSAATGRTGSYVPGLLLGFPVFVSNQMPTNVGGASKSAIILGDWAEALIGERQGLEVAVSSEATVIDADGSTTVNLFATNQSAVRVTERVDFQLRHPAGFVVITNLTA